MPLSKTLWVTIALLGAFVFAALLRGNQEFLMYASTLFVLVGLLIALHRKLRFSTLALWLFNTWLLLHLLGGMATFNGVRLYDVVLIDLIAAPFSILKYDQLVHVICYVAIGRLVMEGLQRGPDWPGKAVVAMLAASGIGGLNEVIEFSAVVMLGSTGVGGYTNTALDLVANVLGAIIGVLTTPKVAQP